MNGARSRASDWRADRPPLEGTAHPPDVLPAPHPSPSAFADQGEANVGCNAASSGYTAGYYSRLLPQLVRTWRTLFDVHFAALVVQLAAYGSTDATPAQRSGDGLPLLREAQRSVYEAPPSGLVHPIDTADNGLNVPLWTPTTCGEHGGIHPRWALSVGSLRVASLRAAAQFCARLLDGAASP